MPPLIILSGIGAPHLRDPIAHGQPARIATNQDAIAFTVQPDIGSDWAKPRSKQIGCDISWKLDPSMTSPPSAPHRSRHMTHIEGRPTGAFERSNGANAEPSVVTPSSSDAQSSGARRLQSLLCELL